MISGWMLGACGGGTAGEDVASDVATSGDTSLEVAADIEPEVDEDVVDPIIPLPTIEGLVALVDENPDPTIVEVRITAQPADVQLTAGDPTAMLTYNGLVPGPLLHARVGDRVIVHFTNALPADTTIHWHGLRIDDAMDGSPMIMAPVPPDGTFTYDFVVPDAGTFWYHTHLHQIQQLERGLYGAIVVHEAEPPAFTAERVVVIDDIRLDDDNQVAPFVASGPDLMAGRAGNMLLANGAQAPTRVTTARGGIERWRIISASNAIEMGLEVSGADVRLIGTDGGLLPEPLPFTRVEIAPGQRYELEVRPHAEADEVVLNARVLVAAPGGGVTEGTFALVRAAIEGDTTATEPVYPTVVLPAVDVAPHESLEWEIGAVNVAGKVQFTIDGQSMFVDDDEHVTLHEFVQGMPVLITITSTVSPRHPFHVHGQFFQIIERNGRPVSDEPGLRDTVQIRGAESATILSYMENPGQWMVHCHISEHGENGMMADIMVGPHGGHGSH